MPKQVSTNLQTVVSQMTNPRDKLKFPQLETWHRYSDQAMVQHELNLSHTHKHSRDSKWREKHQNPKRYLKGKIRL